MQSVLKRKNMQHYLMPFLQGYPIKKLTFQIWIFPFKNQIFFFFYKYVLENSGFFYMHI